LTAEEHDTNFTAIEDEVNAKIDVSGTPTSGQYARFDSASSVEGVDASTLQGDLSLAISDISGLQTALDAKAPTADPTFTGTVTIPDAALAIADVSGLQTALDAKAPTSSPTLSNPTFTGTVTVPDAALAIADVNGLQTALDAKAPTANPTFTGTVTIPDGALAIADVNGLQTALDAKAPTANPTFTGTVTIPDGALAIADTSGLQTALDAKAPLASPTFTGTAAFTGTVDFQDDVTLDASASGGGLKNSTTGGTLGVALSGTYIISNAAFTIPTTAIGDGWFNCMWEVGADTHDPTFNSITLDISAQGFTAGEVYMVVVKSATTIKIQGPQGVFDQTDFA
jgi:hypothetical protein